MSHPDYKNKVVDCKVQPDLSHVKGKTVVITGGAKGMGEAAVRAFVKAGAFAAFGDLDKEAGSKLEKELLPNAKFVPCDVTSWGDQLQLFKTAATTSPNKAVDFAIANAGISGPDEVFAIEDGDEPKKPELKIMNVDLIGAIYTTKIARFYFMKHPLDANHDRCLIINSSLVAYLDIPGSIQYMGSKWACRGILRCLRHTTPMSGIRVGMTAPWYVRTNLISDAVDQYVRSKGVVYAAAEDAAGAMLKIAAEPESNGRFFAIVPREVAPLGYVDIEKDDEQEGTVWSDLQNTILRVSHRLKVKAEDQ